MPTYYIRETRTTEMLIVVEADTPEGAVEKYMRQDTVVEITSHDRIEDVRVSTIQTLNGFDIALP